MRNEISLLQASVRLHSRTLRIGRSCSYSIFPHGVCSCTSWSRLSGVRDAIALDLRSSFLRRPDISVQPSHPQPCPLTCLGSVPRWERWEKGQNGKSHPFPSILFLRHLVCRTWTSPSQTEQLPYGTISHAVLHLTGCDSYPRFVVWSIDANCAGVKENCSRR